tara:strand:- start:214 stop:342 length:129 start_codon:yes stop_codon:yes gene_type:complete
MVVYLGDSLCTMGISVYAHFGKDAECIEDKICAHMDTELAQP